MGQGAGDEGQGTGDRGQGARGKGQGACILGTSLSSEPATTSREPGSTSQLVNPVPGKQVVVVNRPEGTNPFEFIVVSSQRVAQLVKGCTPRVEVTGKHITTAQMEVAAGKVARMVEPPPIPAE